MRVITQSVRLLPVLGIIHNLWRPVPGELRIHRMPRQFLSIIAYLRDF